jgi:hypothetical protein
MKTKEKLAVALEKERAPRSMIVRAREGYYDDFLSPLAMPIHQLVSDVRKYNLTRIAKRAMNGDFDATKEESDAWAASDEGQETIRDLMEGR